MAKTIQKTHVYVVNDQMVVADTIEQAIAIYREDYSDGEPRKVEQICQGDRYMQDHYDALILREVYDDDDD